MSHNYNDFFKAAQKSKKQTPKNKTTQPVEDAMREKLNMRPARKTNHFPPLRPTLALALIFLAAGFGYSQPDLVFDLMTKVEFGAVTAATAADEPTSNAAKTSATDVGGGANSAQTGPKSDSPVCLDPKSMAEEDLSHFKLLSDRKRQLDQREQELNMLEEELHKQRVEVESRIQKLESIRGDISSVLKDRVEMDQERVKTLVEFYSNMKPKQAADIFAGLNEDLAVEVLTKMKKKNAAEIMNLLPPEKAKSLSEKFTGYKRR